METEQNTGRRSPDDFKLVQIDFQTFKWFKNGIPQLVNNHATGEPLKCQ